MSITVEWFIEHRIIKIVMNGDFTTVDLNHASNECVRLMNCIPTNENASPTVHFILDNTHIGDTKSAVLGMYKSSAPLLKDKRMGWMIVYGKNNPMTQYAGTIISQIARSRFRIFSTYDEAIAFLKSNDESLEMLLEQYI